MSTPHLIEGRDYDVVDGLYVFTAAYLRARGVCCESGCLNCPYGFKRQTDEQHPAESTDAPLDQANGDGAAGTA